jgi:sugar phosphate isomerase/epimerase
MPIEPALPAIAEKGYVDFSVVVKDLDDIRFKEAISIETFTDKPSHESGEEAMRFLGHSFKVKVMSHPDSFRVFVT